MATESKKTPAPAADYSGMNIYQKLQIARLKFLRAGMKKTDRNIYLELVYFELNDIVPMVESIFMEVGLLMAPTFGKEYAIAKVFNCNDRGKKSVTFEAPFTQTTPIISNSSKVVTNEMQTLGSSITYIRRYLWQLVPDIIEAGSIDNTSGTDEDTQALPSPPKTTKKVPMTVEKHQETKSELTSAPEGAASEEQAATLRVEPKKFMELDAEQESFVQNVAVKIEGFTKITADVCNQLITGVQDILSAYDTQKG